MILSILMQAGVVRICVYYLRQDLRLSSVLCSLGDLESDPHLVAPLSYQIPMSAVLFTVALRKQSNKISHYTVVGAVVT